MTFSFSSRSGPDLFGTLHDKEWLETNGVGGWASSTLSGAHSRRYHGLLVAALTPPVGRKVMVSKLDESLVVGDQRFSLGCNQFPGALHPEGYQHLVGFEQVLFPVFIYQAGPVTLKKTVVAIHGENTTVVAYEVVEAPTSFNLELLPFYSARDFHSLTYDNDAINKQYVFGDGILRIKNYEDLPEVFISVPRSAFEEDQHWYHRFEYSRELYRGMDFQEDLYSHGHFTVALKKGSKVAVVLSLDDPLGRDGFKLIAAEKKRREKLVKPYRDERVRQLVLAADQFVVQRGSEGLKTIIAGYHWFADWGRDTMIALPGLCLSTGRHDDALTILRAFASFVSEGMLPNRFPDEGETPEYNTIDATLWFFVACYQYYHARPDKAWLKEIIPVLEDIVAWHRKGTRYHIHVDADGLLTGGEEGVQLTWMDAKVGDWVVTPRRGKAVEINSLWYNALRVLADFLHASGASEKAKAYDTSAVQVLEQFNRMFWCEEKQYLYDYIDGEYKNDDLRPNQIYAISLPFPLLDKARAERILNVITQHLLTPRGLRSLDPQHRDYRPVYEGGVWSRDGAYHQGTVWSYLIGPYVDALFYVGGDYNSVLAREIVRNFLLHLEEGCLGTVSEIFDAEPPHAPRGCVAQAWGVAEILRVILRYGLVDEPVPAHDNQAESSQPSARSQRVK